MLVIESNQNHATIKDTEVCPTLPASMGMGGIAFSLDTMHRQQIIMQRTTGTLSPGGHPGSYNGQDAYNDMLVNDGSKGYRKRTIAPDGNVGCDEHAGCHARCASNFEGGGDEMKDVSMTVRRLTPL